MESEDPVSPPSEHHSSYPNWRPQLPSPTPTSFLLKFLQDELFFKSIFYAHLNDLRSILLRRKLLICDTSGSI